MKQQKTEAIQRYEPEFGDDTYIGMSRDDSGEYVLHEDHAARIAELEAIVAAARHLREECRGLDVFEGWAIEPAAINLFEKIDAL